MTASFMRGMADAYQDRCENAPFSSVGGMEQRHNLQAPEYIARMDAEDYLAGYAAKCAEMYGKYWGSCRFEWKSAITLKK